MLFRSDSVEVQASCSDEHYLFVSGGNVYESGYVRNALYLLKSKGIQTIDKSFVNKEVYFCITNYKIKFWLYIQLQRC